MAYLYGKSSKKCFFYSFLTVFTIFDISAKVYSASYIYGGSIWDHFEGDEWLETQGMRFNKDKFAYKTMYDVQVIV